MKNQNLFGNYPLPRTNIQEILLSLLLQGHVTCLEFSWMEGFRTRISELKRKYDLDLLTIKNTRHNKYGNVYTYKIHKLKPSQKEQAEKIYFEMQKQ
jgi:hypothetical protein